jgi:uncharacterized repeat protein (TIGR03803 family)
MIRILQLNRFVAGWTIAALMTGCNSARELPLSPVAPQARGDARRTSATETVIYRFSGSNGALPQAGVIFDGAGNLYGTTTYGGANDLGTAFELLPSGHGWSEQLIHSFGPYSQGQVPTAALSLGHDGDLYSTTAQGGISRNGLTYELKHTKSGWTYAVVQAFDGYNGSEPESGVILHSRDAFGTTASGGPGSASGSGVLFELIRKHGTWSEKVLHLFGTMGAEPNYPQGGLVRDATGNLYGTSTYGGIRGPCNVYTCGTVYVHRPDSTGVHIVYAFKGGSDGQWPLYGLAFDASGNLYGATESTVFELSPTKGTRWKETILHSFAASAGSGRISVVTLDSTGNVYGVTDFGGDPHCFQNGCGLVYKLTRRHGAWSYSVLHAFGGGSDGAFPNGPLVFDATGNLYGTTLGDDTGSDLGTVFEIVMSH